MRINYLHLIIAILSHVATINCQTIQFKFCGKTNPVSPTLDNNGVDQRYKGGIRLDLIRVGKLTLSRTNPFYSLGIAPLSFKDGTWVDGCANNSNQTYCSGCTTCKLVTSTNGSSDIVGSSEGLMQGNVRIRTSNNDLFIESTGNQAVVCFDTNPIDVSGYQGKILEANVIYEGTTVDGFSTVNINTFYRYNSGAWVNLFNQNSNFLRVIDTALLINVKVPSAVNNLDGIVEFEISPNPIHEKLHIDLNSQKTFDGNASIRNILGQLYSEKEIFIQEGNNNIDINTRELHSGIYLFQISDKEGRISTKKFVK